MTTRYLPVHKAMFNSIKAGMTLHNRKAWVIAARNDSHLFASRPNCTQALSAHDTTYMYISIADIHKMKPFCGGAYIKKYAEFAVTEPNSAHLPTHAELIATLVDQAAEAKQALRYLPMTLDFIPHLKPGMLVVHNGGSAHKMQGEAGIVTGTCNDTPFSTSKYTFGIDVDYESRHPQLYSVEWFAKYMYISTKDLAAMPWSRIYLDKFEHRAKSVDELKEKQPRKYSEVGEEKPATKEDQACLSVFRMLYGDYSWLEERVTQRAEVEARAAEQKAQVAQLLKEHNALKEYTEHEFSLDKEPTKWVAISQHNTTLTADTQGGIKAKVALAIAEDPTLVYEVFAKVGNVKAEPTLKFF